MAAVLHAKQNNTITRWVMLILIMGFSKVSAHSDEHRLTIIDTVSRSVVAIGRMTPLYSNRSDVLGTGFVIGTGNYVVTNHHVVAEPLDENLVQSYVVITGRGRQIKYTEADIVATAPRYDLAILKIKGALPPLVLNKAPLHPPGTSVAFTGFPISGVLGVYPATHRGYVSALTPDVLPADRVTVQSARNLSRLDNPATVYQLDATAFPGNSGSPLYLPESGEVIGIVNKVYISEGKESALTAPSGISYAIPSIHIQQLLSTVMDEPGTTGHNDPD
ncbi:serine protease [Alteromonas sp. ASW11-19]|uniref:Serine protease n=1 Tax=Alteromonas salexigens TaxID=2982530 RepID=A0ABT2VTS1_9ALTE|nr:serine protease [Alteromonas salexigens]MCU7555641.1 serine protease [Alteromonas salexigens]